MAFTNEQLSAILDRTDGCCHICGRRLIFKNYGRFDLSGAWEVEHSRPRAYGGCSRLCNLFAAHIECNRAKGVTSSRTARAWFDRTRAPLSRTRKEDIRTENRWGWGTACALSGAALAGPAGFFIGAVLGALVGDSIKPQ